jgi:hypothetical protein
MNVKQIIIAVPISIFWSCLTFGQSLNVDIQTIDSLDKSIINNIVYDINGEICNLIIVKTDLDSLKFYSNLGTERIEKQDSGYRIWVSPATSILRISIPGLPLHELNLPNSGFPNAVYLIYLSSIVRENIVYKDTVTIKPFFSISSEPSGASVYIDKKFAGVTPFVIENPTNNIFNYKIMKLGFSTFVGTDSLDPLISSINVSLEDLRHTRRMFIAGSLFSITESKSPLSKFFGLSIGKIGKTSWYSTIRFVSKKPAEIWDPENPIWGVYNSYPYSSEKLQLIGGLTQQVTNSFFFLAGAGYTLFNSGYIEGYYLDDKFYLSKIYDTSYHGFNMDLGMSFRILWYFVLSGNITFDFGFSDKKVEFKAINYGIGGGFNFGVKNRKK